MDEMNAIESAAKIAEEKTLWKILNILNDCKDIEEAKKKIRTLLDQ